MQLMGQSLARPRGAPLGELHLSYFRTRGMFREARDTLATHPGDLRVRLDILDKELFMLPETQVPEDLHQEYADLRRRCTKLKASNGEGPISATFRRSRIATLEGIAQIIVDLCHEFDGFC